MVWKCWENCSSACAGSAPAGHPPRRSDEAAPRRQAGQFVALPGFWLSCVTQRVFDSWQSDWWLLGPRPLRTDHVSLALQDARVGPAWSYQGHARYDGASDNSPHRAAREAALSNWSQELDMDDLVGFHVGMWDYILSGLNRHRRGDCWHHFPSWLALRICIVTQIVPRLSLLSR